MGRPRWKHNRSSRRHTAYLHEASKTSNQYNDIIGSYHKVEPFGVVVPLSRNIHFDVFTPLDEGAVIPEGALVRVRITRARTAREAAWGSVTEILSLPDDPHFFSEEAIATNQFATHFSEASLRLAKACSVDEQHAFKQGYRDKTGVFVVTIDPHYARDFDDALSAEMLPDKTINLGVYIADVSYYVRPDTALDCEAKRRAVSVYLPDRVLPMLPEALSCDVCSLVQDRPRRVIGVHMHIGLEGEILSCEIAREIICSSARLTYDQVYARMSGDNCDRSNVRYLDDTSQQPRKVDIIQDKASALSEEHLESLISVLSECAERRSARRVRLGGLDIDTLEVRAELDTTSVPIGVSKRGKTRATQMVEEAMIAANECVARVLAFHGRSSLYRVHQSPDVGVLPELAHTFSSMSWMTDRLLYRCERGDVTVIGDLLEAAKDAPEKEFVVYRILRALKRAHYSTQPLGHFGLGLADYCHFTSPIRRYPDIVVHRSLSDLLKDHPLVIDDMRDISCSERFSAALARPSHTLSDTHNHLARYMTEAQQKAERAEVLVHAKFVVWYYERFIGEVFPAVVMESDGLEVIVRINQEVDGVVASSVQRDPSSYASSKKADKRDALANEGDLVFVRILDAVRGSAKLVVEIIEEPDPS